MASDGSTSMATVCGGSLALMDAGIQLREHVAGVSVGLISDVDPSSGMIKDYHILTDILGLEDHLGDMDFKIAGTKKGITAIQLDIKPAGIPLDIICESLEPARKGRFQILDRMEEEISAPRAMAEGGAPHLVTMNLSDESLRRLFSRRKQIEKETGTRIDIGDGRVTIVARNESMMEKAQEKIYFLVGRQIEVGKTYKGVISSIKEYGAFVEFNGGQQGLLHISELSHEQVSKVSDVVSVGQELSLMCIAQDVRGNIKLSLRATIPVRKNVEHKYASDNAHSVTKGSDESSSVQKIQSEDNEEDSFINLTPPVIIRSAAECDVNDSASGKKAKSSPRSHNSTDVQKNVEKLTNFSNSSFSNRKYVQSSVKNTKVTKVIKGSDSQQISSLLKSLEMKDSTDDNLKTDSPTKVRAGSLKLGDKVIAKVHEIRTRGLVLELAGGLKGMYIFQGKGKGDFEVGKELHVKCSSFNTKGTPVFSLLEIE